MILSIDSTVDPDAHNTISEIINKPACKTLSKKKQRLVAGKHYSAAIKPT